jgi:hypothetical protein
MAGTYNILIGPTRSPEGKTPFVDKVDIEFQPGGSANSVANPVGLEQGVPSIFNPYAIVVFPGLNKNYNRVIDDYSGANSSTGNFTPSYAGDTPNIGKPTISRLVEDPTLALKTPYYYTDFLYCKYVGKIPNNQLVTLRRYPAPTFDNLGVPGARKDSNTQPSDNANNPAAGNSSNDVEGQKEFFPIAQAVTWFGEATENKLSDILSFTVNLNWKNVEAEVNTVAGNEQGAEDSPGPGVAKLMGILTGQVNTPFETQNAQYDPYNNGPYAHRIYGPVNVVSKTYKRDRGLDFKQSITLNFEYTLKSIGNINPKAAMLDLMSNLLALTYNNGAFWGGANRYFPQKPTYPFLGGKDGMNAWYRGEPAAFAKAVGTQISAAKSTIMDVLDRLAADPITELKNLAAGAAKLGMIAMNKGRAPDILAIKALLTGEPIGEWHMVVGNPFDPIAKIGNLICTEAKFQFNDVIGADNFPTELKVTITVEHGRPRDAGDIQSMFNSGEGRTYYPPKGQLDQLNYSSATRNSTNDTSWKTGNNSSGNTSKSTQSVGLFSGSPDEFDQILGSVKNAAGDLQGAAAGAWNLADKMFLRNAGSKTNTGN